MARPKKLKQGVIKKKLTPLLGWALKKNAIVWTHAFSSYPRALKFVNRLGQAAEKADHHPDMAINYTTVTVKLSTHSAGGVTILDLDMAAQAQRIYEAL